MSPLDPKAGCIVTVRFAGDARRAQEVLRAHPDLERAIREGTRHHGLIRSTQLVGDGEYLDIDEWPDRAHRDAFVTALAPQLNRWSELAGVTHIESRLWRPTVPGKEF